MIIGIDFDGTCVTHEFPKVGRSIGAEPYLRALVDNGHKLILFTMRSDRQQVATKDANIHPTFGPHLSDAVRWFLLNDIELWGINGNPDQHTWTDSPKAYCQLYIDDAALGCPLITSESEKPYVDWVWVGRLLAKQGLISNSQFIDARFGVNSEWMRKNGML